MVKGQPTLPLEEPEYAALLRQRYLGRHRGSETRYPFYDGVKVRAQEGIGGECGGTSRRGRGTICTRCQFMSGLGMADGGQEGEMSESHDDGYSLGEGPVMSRRRDSPSCSLFATAATLRRRHAPRCRRTPQPLSTTSTQATGALRTIPTPSNGTRCVLRPIPCNSSQVEPPIRTGMPSM